jgi:predicted nucleic acid-binding protein
MRNYVYDSGALIAIDRSRDNEQVRSHQRRLAGGDHILVPAPVAAQVVRDSRCQARLMLTLRSCEIVPFEADDVTPVGELLARSGTADVVAGFVALKAAEVGAVVITSDPGDITRLLNSLGALLPVMKP